MGKDISAIVRQVIPVFLQHGYEGATLSRISEATGLGRASLYHHFPGGKERIAEAALEYLGELFDATVLTPLQNDKPPIENLKNMSESLKEFYNQGHNTCILSVFSLGEGHDLFHIQMQEALKTWIDSLSAVLVKDGLDRGVAHQRAENAVIQIQGSLVVTRVLGNTEAFERVLNNLPEQLLN